MTSPRGAIAPAFARRSTQLLLKKGFPALALFQLSLGNACERFRRHAIPAESVAKWQRDSAAYEQVMIAWRHDSLVIDSLAASIPIAGLTRGYVRMLNDSSSSAAMLELSCEEMRLGSRYGSRALLIADKRVQRLVFDSASAANRRHIDASALHPRTVRLGVTICHDSILHPDSAYHGANLNVPPPKPVRPRPPS